MEKKNFCSALVLAAGKGDTEEVEKLYKTISTLASKEAELYYALYFAAFNGQKDVVKCLLSKGINPNLVIGTYLTPLHAAALKGFERIVKMLLNHGANVDPKIKVTSGKKKVEANYFCSPLLGAVYNKHDKVVDLLLQRGASVNVKLHSKTDKLKDDFEKHLTYGNLPSFILTEDFWLGYSPLHFAVQNGKKNTAKLLLEFGADVNARCAKDLTPLCLACNKNDTSLIQFLLKAGADMKAEVSNGMPLLRCILHQNFENSLGECYEGYDKKDEIIKNEAFRLLLKLGADPNGWSTREKESLLHKAVGIGNANAVHLLLKHGANINAVDDKAKTPFQYAVSHLKEILEDIQDYCYAPDSSSDEDYYDRRLFTDSSEEEAHEQELEDRRKAREEERTRQYENRKIYNLTHNKYVYNVWQYQRNHNHQDGYSVFKDPDPYRMICQLMTRELVRLEAMGEKNIEQNVALLKTAFVKPYYTRCKNELKKLKKHVLANGINYYDFLLANDSKLKEYMKNNEIVSAIDKEKIRKLFPNYSRFLNFNMKRGLKRKRPVAGEESNGSSDEDEGKGSVQIRGKAKRRRQDFCVVS